MKSCDRTEILKETTRKYFGKLSSNVIYVFHFFFQIDKPTDCK